jgi:Terminase large subunit, T4likevirus-type, N-terminal
LKLKQLIRGATTAMAKSNSSYHNLAAALSPVFFARCLGIEPDPWQQEVLRSDSKRIILNCARQTGKSSVAAILALHRALFVDKSMVIIISHTLQQASETFRNCRDYYRQIAHPVHSITESAHRLELENGSRIVTLTGQRPDSIRGFSNVSLLIIDEAAQIPDESYQTARPMVAISRGSIILLSTPYGKLGFFFEAWQNEDEWLKVEVNADQCPRITPEFLAEERKKYPEWFFRQEYYCDFRDRITSLLSREVIDAAFVDRPGRNLVF